MSDATASLTLDSLRDLLQQAGYRVETVSDPATKQSFLRSATGGLAFDVRPGNRMVGNEQDFVDAMFVAVLQIQGDLPLAVINRWNTTRRFGRLQIDNNFLVLAMDVTLVGGVSPAHLRAQVEIWDRLAHELVSFLRTELSNTNGIDAAAALAQRTAEPARAANETM
jgi:hypothetical protein